MPDFKDIMDKYLVIHVAKADLFIPDTLHSFSIDEEKGISHVLGKIKGTATSKVQAYVFNKDKWTLDDARNWVKQHKKSKEYTKAEFLGRKRTFVNASAILSATKPSLIDKEGVTPLTPELFAKSSLNDKYYFYVEGVHEGKNKNGDVFYRDELVKNYKSAGHQLIDWEHLRDQVIGFSLDSELISDGPDDPVAIAFNGILNRLSPFMQAEEIEGDTVQSRDEIVRQRHFEDKLAFSMECFFDKAKCEACGYITDDALDFHLHVMMNHRTMFEDGTFPGRGLIGVDFCGWGLVKYPADPEAYATGLRTSEDGTIQEILEASDKEKYGALAANIKFAHLVAEFTPSDVLIDDNKLIFASELIKYNDNSTKKNINNDKNKKGKSVTGGTIMFKLTEKVSKDMPLSEIFVIAQRTLSDFQGDKALSAEEIEAFASELSEVVKSKISEEFFKVSDIYTLTNEAKLSAIEAARKEEKEIAQAVINDLQGKNDALEAEKTALSAKITEKDTKISQLENAEKDKAIEAKINEFMADLASSGLKFSEEFEKDMRSLVKSKVDNEDALKDFKKSLVASYKQSVLTEASNNSAGISNGGDGSDPESLEAKIKKIKENLKNN